MHAFLGVSQELYVDVFFVVFWLLIRGTKVQWVRRYKCVSDRVAPDGERSGTPYARGAVADPPAHLLGGAMGVLNAHTVSSLSNLLRRRKHQVYAFRVPRRLCVENFRVRAIFLDENSVF